MGTQDADIAIHRIEQALARIEAAATRPVPKPAPGLAELTQRHEALLKETKAAMGEIDALIAQSGAR
jgi:hypothetical protein